MAAPQLPPPTQRVLCVLAGCSPANPNQPLPAGEAARAWGGSPKSSSGETVMFMRQNPFQGQQALWVSTFVPGATAAHLDRYCNHDPSGQFLGGLDKIDKMLKRRTEIGRGPAGGIVSHIELKSPMMGVGPRDFIVEGFPAVYLAAEHQQRFDVLGLSQASPAIASGLAAAQRANPAAARPTGRVLVYGCAPCNGAVGPDGRQQAPPAPAKGVVRGTMHTYGLVAVEREGGCDVHFVVCADAAGMLPAMVVDSVSGDQMQVIVKLRKRVAEELASGALRPEGSMPPPGRFGIRVDGQLRA